MKTTSKTTCNNCHGTRVPIINCPTCNGKGSDIHFSKVYIDWVKTQSQYAKSDMIFFYGMVLLTAVGGLLMAMAVLLS